MPKATKLKIGFVFDVYPTISTFILNQISGLLDLGHDVYLFPKYKGDNTLPKLHDDRLSGKIFYPVKYEFNRWEKYRGVIKMIFTNIHRHPRPILNALNFFIQGRNALNFTLLYKLATFLPVKIDVVQVHFGDYADLPVFLLRMGFKFKLFTMFHGYDIRKGIEEGGHIYKDVFQYSTRILSISGYNTKYLNSFGCPEEKIVNHPVGINIAFFQCRNRFAFKKRVEILSVGRLVWEKGYQYALEAIKFLKKAGYNFHFTIIGEGYERKKITRYIIEENLETVVTLVGKKQSDMIKKFMCESDIYLMSSVAEALPVVLMEASAAGMPIVATDVGSVKEIIDDNRTGLLTSPSNSQQLYEKLCQYFNDPAYAITLGKVAQKHVNEKFNIDVLNKRLSALYQTGC